MKVTSYSNCLPEMPLVTGDQIINIFVLPNSAWHCKNCLTSYSNSLEHGSLQEVVSVQECATDICIVSLKMSPLTFDEFINN